MENAKHTPGPWLAVRNSAFWEIKPVNCGEAGIPLTIGDVCSTAPGFPDGGLQEANARLVAAAPELLEVAARLVRIAGSQYHGDDAAEQFDALVIKARSAIAKATGEQ